MAEPTAPPSAFSTFLRGMNKTERDRPVGTAPTTAPTIEAMAEVARELVRRSGVKVPTAPAGADAAALEALVRQAMLDAMAKAPPQPAVREEPKDQKSAILAALADAPRTLAEISAATGLAPGAVIDAMRPLEEFRLVRRVEQEEDLAFALTKGGLALVRAAG
jgi:hypothetical protein